MKNSLAILSFTALATVGWSSPPNASQVLAKHIAAMHALTSIKGRLIESSTPGLEWYKDFGDLRMKDGSIRTLWWLTGSEWPRSTSPRRYLATNANSRTWGTEGFKTYITQPIERGMNIDDLGLLFFDPRSKLKDDFKFRPDLSGPGSFEGTSAYELRFDAISRGNPARRLVLYVDSKSYLVKGFLWRNVRGDLIRGVYCWITANDPSVTEESLRFIPQPGGIEKKWKQ